MTPAEMAFAKLTVRLLELKAQSLALVGSTYILGQGADIDVLVWVISKEQFAARLEAEGFVREGNANYPVGDFISLRKGEYNVLLVDSEEYFNNFKLSAEVCKALLLQDKEDRIRVHGVIRDGKSAEEVQAPF